MQLSVTRTSIPGPYHTKKSHHYLASAFQAGRTRRRLGHVAAASNSSPSAAASYGNASDNIRAVKAEILRRVDALGTQAILPGRPADKARVDALVAELKQLQPANSWSSRLGPTSRSLDDGSTTVANSISPAQADSQLYGRWQLVYASNGTAVTRTSFAQALITASTQLPGIGINGIRQILRKEQQGAIATSNEAEFGFGLLGSWQVSIEGTWKVPATAIAGDVSCVKVVFEQFRVRPVGLLGLKLPDWLPELLLSLGAEAGDAGRSGAEWFTTYLDEDMRVGEGKTGNLFLFRKLADSNT